MSSAPGLDMLVSDVVYGQAKAVKSSYLSNYGTTGDKMIDSES